MLSTAKDVGVLVQQARKALGLTQETLAMLAGTGLRFISELENGKPTCELEKTLTVLKTLGVRINATTTYSDVPPLYGKD